MVDAMADRRVAEIQPALLVAIELSKASWLLEPRRRAERAVVQVVAESYLRGVSVRRVEGLVQALGIDRLSRSRVSEIAKELDELVAAFRCRPLDGGPYAYVWLDAHAQRCRNSGRVVNVATVTAIGVNASGHREVLGCDVITSEDGAGWTAFLRDLVTRGLAGVRLVVSDDHQGLKQAVAAVLPGAAWQRCRTHFVRNLLTRVPRSAQALVATLVRSIFAQPTAEEVRAQHGRVVEQLEGRFRAAAALLVEAAEDILAFAAFPPSTGAGSGRTTRWSGCTARSAGAPTWSASSRTARRCCAWSARCSPSSTTGGRSRAATWPWRAWPRRSDLTGATPRRPRRGWPPSDPSAGDGAALVHHLDGHDPCRAWAPWFNGPAGQPLR